METSKFFSLDQWQWYQEFVNAEVFEINNSTIPHDENFFVELDL